MPMPMPIHRQHQPPCHTYRRNPLQPTLLTHLLPKPSPTEGALTPPSLHLAVPCLGLKFLPRLPLPIFHGPPTPFLSSPQAPPAQNPLPPPGTLREGSGAHGTSPKCG
ncbi:hypothetical protein P154DRAFT_624121 [Amniculicola lignicola CBS 123094]|uniref:Uncharacterized protein n=1 Tax=Amniculicola lignicola CBS 123094 TaxID=1392246 RepID=A0A6A5W010_9PLEO|nr:hypothetical protein P154DRAFT_624121 [Amniculicola lignicola CBS 123094]